MHYLWQRTRFTLSEGKVNYLSKRQNAKWCNSRESAISRAVCNFWLFSRCQTSVDRAMRILEEGRFAFKYETTWHSLSDIIKTKWRNKLLYFFFFFLHDLSFKLYLSDLIAIVVLFLALCVYEKHRLWVQARRNRKALFYRHHISYNFPSIRVWHMLQGLSYQAVEHVVLVFSHTADSLTIDYMLDPMFFLFIFLTSGIYM